MNMGFRQKKVPQMYSECNANPEYVILFEKSRGQKNGLIDTCTFQDRLLSGL